MAATSMTIRQALAAAMSPYALPKQTVELLLIEQGFDGDAEYKADIDKKQFYTAVVDGLYKVITLEKEKDPGTENAYDTDKVKELINYYQKKYDIEDPTDYEFINRTEEW
jgi:hypothetical protein